MKPGKSRWWQVGLTLGLAIILAGCGSTTTIIQGGGGGGATATATATSSGGGSPAPTATTPHTAPPHAFAWSQMDSHNVPQIWASLNGGTPQQITHVAPDGSECDDQDGWSPPVFSPDLKHIVASMGSYNCADATLNGPVSVITVAGGAVTTYIGTDVVDIDARSMGWIDNNIFWFVGNNTGGTHTGPGIYEKPISGGQPGKLYATTNDTWDAVYRAPNIIFQQGVPSTNNITWSIHSFNVSSNSLGSVNIAQGQTGICNCGSGGPHGPGWDVTQDGQNVTYQYVNPETSDLAGVASSHLYTSAINGSGKHQVATAFIGHSSCVLLYSWSGGYVSITEATPSPTTLTTNLTAGNLHTYTPDSTDYPVWKWDNSEFWADTSSGISDFFLTGSSSLGVAHGLNPWYTIGS